MLQKPCFYAETARECFGIWVHAGAYAIRPYETPCFYAGADPGMLGGRPKKGPEWAATKIPGRRGVEALQIRGEGAMSYWLVERALIS